MAAPDPNGRTRPLSPHLDVYKWQIQMVTSILHRATGIALVAGMLGLVWGLVALAGGEKSWAAFNYVRRSNVSVQSGNASYILDGVSVQFKQGIGSRGKWMATLLGGYAVYHYQGNVFASRVDNAYRVSTGLDYLIQVWLTAGVSYEFNKFDSTYSGVSDYDVHRITVKLAVGY